MQFLLLVVGKGEGGVAREMASAVLLLLPAINSHFGRIAMKYCRWRTSLADSRGFTLAAALARV